MCLPDGEEEVDSLATLYVVMNLSEVMVTVLSTMGYGCDNICNTRLVSGKVDSGMCSGTCP
jgi:hypothetical protein